jgi:hypothetical protein
MYEIRGNIHHTKILFSTFALGSVWIQSAKGQKFCHLPKVAKFLPLGMFGSKWQKFWQKLI